MKKLIKSILFILTTSVIILSCQDQGEEVIQKNELLSAAEIEKLAKQHNEALEQTLVGLKNSKASSIENPDEMELLLNKELNFFYNSNFDGNNLLEANNHSQKEVSKFFSRTSSNSRLLSLTPIEIVIEESDDKLSAEQIELLKEVDDILNSITADINPALSALDEIQNKAISTLSEEEAQVILVGAEVGKASISYWYENIDKWDEIINGTENGRIARTEGWFDWGEVGGSDVAGAVGGATGAWVVNTVPGLGQASYAGAIVGGAAGASAADAVMQVWNHYF